MRPAVARRAPPLGHRRSRGVGDLERRLVARRLDHHVIARLEERVVCDEDCFLRRRDNHDVVRRQGLVDRSNRGPQLWSTYRLGVAEPLRQDPLQGIGLEREQVGNRDRFGVARREHVRGRELVDGVVLLDPERCDLHACTLRCGVSLYVTTGSASPCAAASTSPRLSRANSSTAPAARNAAQPIQAMWKPSTSAWAVSSAVGL